MRRRRIARTLLLAAGLAAVLPLAAQVGTPGGAQAGTPMSTQLRIDGDVKNPLLLKVEDLRAFPAEQLATLTVHRQAEDKDQVSTLRGVRLKAILDKAGLAETDRHDWKHAVVLAVGTDGYAVVYSWPELFNTDYGNDVLVVFERDGQALPEREGRIALAPGHDVRSGPRSVHWLAHLEVRILKAAPPSP